MTFLWGSHWLKAASYSRNNRTFGLHECPSGQWSASCVPKLRYTRIFNTDEVMYCDIGHQLHGACTWRGLARGGSKSRKYGMPTHGRKIYGHRSTRDNTKYKTDKECSNGLEQQSMRRHISKMEMTKAQHASMKIKLVITPFA
jgi:hypothetical protein